MDSPNAKKTPRLIAPKGACDTHTHFYNAAFPSAPTALMTPPDARVEDYRELQQRLGLERVVIVQPSTYGLDNSCQLAAMKAIGENARAVVVVDNTITSAELERMTRLGVRGARFHLFPGGAVPQEMLEEVAARVHDFGWHIQLHMDGREFPLREEVLKRLPGMLVVDHVGRFPGPTSIDDRSFKALLRLLETGRCWVKLSAPYLSSSLPGWADVAPLARALVKAAPDRMLWASDWPHPGHQSPPDEADLLDLLLDWVDDETVRNRILVDNPAALYGF